MAYLAAAAIQKRVREVLEQAAGNLRVIAAGTYDGDMPENEGDMERARAVITGARVEALCTSIERNPSSPPLYSNLALYNLSWRVRVTRQVDRTAQISDAARDLVKAAAMQDSDVLRQALEFPRNLATTAAGTATGIVSGLMTFVGSTLSVRGPVDDGSSIIETDHRFTCIAQSAPATS